MDPGEKPMHPDRKPMRLPTLEEQKELVRNWEETGRLLDEMRREALRDKPYDWEEVDALSWGTIAPPRDSSGMVEMQRVFMKARRPESGDSSIESTTLKG
jgi:hypothetical protein